MSQETNQKGLTRVTDVRGHVSCVVRVPFNPDRIPFIEVGLNDERHDTLVKLLGAAAAAYIWMFFGGDELDPKDLVLSARIIEVT